MRRTFLFFEKGTRAYTLTLERDLLGDWVIWRTWGPKNAPYSQKRVEVFESEQDAFKRLEALTHQRIKQREYQLMSKKMNAI